MTEHCVDISSAAPPADEEPDQESLRQWLLTVMTQLELSPSEVSVHLVNKADMQALNLQYRDQDKPTNVLSFESGIPADWATLDGPLPLGDIVICREVVADEAMRFNKPLPERTAHMLVHGLLHLLGHDHENKEEQAAMEALETRMMNVLGYADPYETGADPVQPTHPMTRQTADKIHE